LHYEWKGNVRELINIMERLVVLSPSTLITVEQLPDHLKEGPTLSPPSVISDKTLKELLEETEKQILLKARKKYITTIRMADALGTSQPSIVRKLKKYRIY
jgi:transcriptional regulator with PAS, ATPase and Fis domain